MGGLEESTEGLSLKGRLARVVVAVDFGTTFSGFAYSHITSPAEIHKFYEWEGVMEANAVSYCKTQSSLYYTKSGGGGWKLEGWGWPASVAFTHDSKNRAKEAKKNPDKVQASHPEGVLLQKFKLHLAGATNVSNSEGGLSAEPLPEGLSLDTAITDYLAGLAALIMQQLQTKYGPQLTSKEVQWCLTVPAIWDDGAKQKMKVYAERAGMVQGRNTPKGVIASPHKLLICLEPEAASLCCLDHAKDIQLQEGDHYLVADIGGGTVDIIVHEKASRDGEELKVREVVASYGGLCGGTYADQSFEKFLKRKVGCYEEYTADKVPLHLEVQRKWELGKRSYNGELKSPFVFNFPAGLATAWEEHDKSQGIEPREAYDELELENDDMKEILDPVVSNIVELIRKELTDKIKTIMVVGGFSASPYLMRKINDEFSGQVQKIINPPEPGAAICHGAVLMGLAPEGGILFRKSRKTYGIKITRKAIRGDPYEKRYYDEEGEQCKDVFSSFVYIGDELGVNERVSKDYRTSRRDQRSISISVYSSSSQAEPDFVTDEGVELDGSFEMDISDGLDKGLDRSVEVTMFFGKSTIEIQGRRKDFGDTEKIEHFVVNIPDV